MDQFTSIIVFSFLACFCLYPIVVMLLFLFAPKCYICGRRREKYIVHVSSGQQYENGEYYGGHDEERYHEITQCPQCGKKICYLHWHDGAGCCINCVPEWIRRVDEAERLEEKRKSKERQDKWEEEQRKEKEEAKRQTEERQAKALKEQQEMEKERKCHVCGKPGSEYSKKCGKCNEWTCHSDLYHNICKRCHETFEKSKSNRN